MGEKPAAIGIPTGSRAPVSNDGRYHSDSGGKGVPLSQRGTIFFRMDGGRCRRMDWEFQKGYRMLAGEIVEWV